MEIERAERVLFLQLEWIKTADSKVPPLFAINIAMLGIMAALIKTITTWTIATAIASSISTLLLLLSMSSLALCMFPRLDGPKGSSIFFGGIAKQVEVKFKEGFSSQSDANYLDDTLSQAYKNAVIASEKYWFVKLAFIFTFSSIPVWIISVYLLYI